MTADKLKRPDCKVKLDKSMCNLMFGLPRKKSEDGRYILSEQIEKKI